MLLKTYMEVYNYIDVRYVSAPETIWRLLELNMHERSYSVIRLPVHLPNQQEITFVPGHEEESLEAAHTGQTKLKAWSRLNQNSPEAKALVY